MDLSAIAIGRRFSVVSESEFDIQVVILTVEQDLLVCFGDNRVATHVLVELVMAVSEAASAVHEIDLVIGDQDLRLVREARVTVLGQVGSYPLTDDRARVLRIDLIVWASVF